MTAFQRRTPPGIARIAWISWLTLSAGWLWSADSPEAVVREALGGKDIPFHLLPKDRNGKIVPIETARALVKTERNLAVKQHMDAFFPSTSRGDKDLWSTVHDSSGRIHLVPNQQHPNYASFVEACERSYDAIDQRYQQNYGDKYRAFSEEVFGGADKDKVQLVGRNQDKLFSDIDATFKDPAVRDALVETMRQNGLTVEAADHGLYVKVKELDWLQWGNETVADLRQQFEDETDPSRKQELSNKLSAAMKDVEVCATTAGAQHKLFGTGAEDPMGAKLDNIKKFVQADDVYTKDKITNKLIKDDLGADAYRQAMLDPDRRASQVLSDHGGEKRALRMEGLPASLQADLTRDHIARRTDELVDSYRKGAVATYTLLEKQQRLADSYRIQAARHDEAGDDQKAKSLRAIADSIDEERKLVVKTNEQTMREIRLKDPALAERLRGANIEALQSLKKQDPSERDSRDYGTARSEVRKGFDLAGKLEAWAPVAKDAANRLADQTGAVFDKVGTLGGYASKADEAMQYAAAGKGSAATHFAKAVASEVAMDKATEALTNKFPKLAGVLEVMDVPQMVVAEMEAEMEKAEARGGNMWHAKAVGILNTIKKKTWIETFENVLNEEGMAEVEREMANGNYSWTRVAFNTATRATGEITQLNAIMRFGNDTYYGVYEKEQAAKREVENLRHKLRAKTLSSDAGLEALRQEIIRLQLDVTSGDAVTQARIEALQKQYDRGVKGMIELGQKMRKQFGTDDRQVEDLYKRAQIARESQQADLLEAKLIRMAATRDSMSIETWIEMNRVRDQYREEINKFRDATKKLHVYRDGSGDPLVREMMGKLERMKKVSQTIERIDVNEVIRNQRWREVEQQQSERAAELQSYAERVKREAGKLPPGIDPGDGALMIEMDDLMLRQRKGEIPMDADLVKLAGENLARDIAYRELVRQQEQGSIPKDADLLAILDGSTADSGNLSGARATGQATPPGGNATAFAGITSVGSASVTTQEPRLADEPVYPGLDGNPLPFPDPGYIRQPWNEQGPRHGMVRFLNSNGSLSRIAHYRDNQLQGPELRYDATGRTSSEEWYNDGHPHGWKRNWNKNGSLAYEEFREYRNGGTQVHFRRNYRIETGLLSSETYYDLNRPDPANPRNFPQLTREYDSAGVLKKQYQRLANGNPYGTWIDVFSDGRVKEAVYGDDGREVAHRLKTQAGYLLEQAGFSYDPQGRRLLHGDCMEYFPEDSPHAGMEIVKATFRDGLPDGQFIERDQNSGAIRRQGSFRLGRPDGEWIFNDSEGDPVARAQFRQGELEGNVREYFTDGYHNSKGVLRRELQVEGSGIKAITRFSESGAPLESITGTFRTGLSANGPIELEPVTELRHVASMNVPVSSLLPRDLGVSDLVTGEHIRFYKAERGEPVMQSEEEIRDGILHGRRRLYFPDGRLGVEESVENGVLHGPCKAWFTDGQQSAAASFDKGVLHGQLQYRTGPQHAMQQDVQVSRGYLIGWSVSYSAEGKRTQAAHYAFPRQPMSRESLIKRPVGGVSAERPPTWANPTYGDIHGPVAYYADFEPSPMGTAQPNTLTFIYIDASGQRNQTSSVQEYLEWVKQDSSLPTDVPFWPALE